MSSNVTHPEELGSTSRESWPHNNPGVPAAHLGNLLPRSTSSASIPLTLDSPQDQSSKFTDIGSGTGDKQRRSSDTFTSSVPPPAPSPPSRKDSKSPKRTYHDHGITPSLPVFGFMDDSKTPESRPFSFRSLYTRFVAPNSISLPEELPSHTRTVVSDSGLIREKDPGVITTTSSRPFFDSQPFWLALYFCFNLGLTLYNKGVLIHFPFAYTLTAIHALFGTVGGVLFLKAGMYTPKRLSHSDTMALAAFSVLYTVNIAVSNLSLEMVTIPFHQVVRAATPIFTIFISMALFGSRCNRQKFASLIPLVVGVGLATYGDYYYTMTGLVLTVLGTLLAAIKTVYTSILQSQPSAAHPPTQASALRFIIPPRLQLHPLDLLTRMAPLAFVQCILLAHISGELDRVRRWSVQEMSPWTAAVLACNGVIAFGLNIVSFTANKKAGPLSMTVAANVKQVLSIIIAVMIFNLSISPLNGIGIFLTLAGGAWYAAVEYEERKARARR